MSGFDLAETTYGFRWGPFRIERVACDPRRGVMVYMGSDTEQYEMNVSPDGQVDVVKRDRPFWYEQQAGVAESREGQS